MRRTRFLKRQRKQIGRVVEKRTWPYHPWQHSTSQVATAVHAPSAVLDDNGKWHDVAFCSSKIFLSDKEAKRVSEPCSKCLYLLRRHGLLEPR